MSEVRVLLASGDPLLREEVGRLAAAAAMSVDVVDHAAAAMARWSVDDVVLVGGDLAGEIAELAPPRRADVVVAVAGGATDDCFRNAFQVGAQSLVQLPAQADHLADLLTDLADPPVTSRVIGVMGGVGGAGASTLAVALAQYAARSGPTLLVDADALGAGVDRMLGLEDRTGVRWQDLHATHGRVAGRHLREGVPCRGDLGVLTWAHPPRPLDLPTARRALTAARRGFPMVVVDLPRRSDAVAEVLVRECDEVLVVCPASINGVAAVSRLAGVLSLPPGRTRLVVRPGALLAEDVRAATGLDIAATLGHQRGLTAASDAGLGSLASGRGPLSRVVATLLDEQAA